jgi:hypothetical protein
MNIFITLLENVNKSRTSANNLSLTNTCKLVTLTHSPGSRVQWSVARNPQASPSNLHDTCLTHNLSGSAVVVTSGVVVVVMMVVVGVVDVVGAVVVVVVDGGVEMVAVVVEVVVTAKNEANHYVLTLAVYAQGNKGTCSLGEKKCV